MDLASPSVLLASSVGSVLFMVAPFQHGEPTSMCKSGAPLILEYPTKKAGKHAGNALFHFGAPLNRCTLTTKADKFGCPTFAPKEKKRAAQLASGGFFFPAEALRDGGVPLRAEAVQGLLQDPAALEEGVRLAGLQGVRSLPIPRADFGAPKKWDPTGEWAFKQTARRISEFGVRSSGAPFCRSVPGGFWGGGGVPRFVGFL